MTSAAFSACYADWKLIKTRACVQIILEIPIEKANEAYSVLGGMPVAATEVWCAVARLDPNKIAVVAASEGGEVATPHDNPPSHRLTTRAVLLCKDELFRKFLEEHAKMTNVTEDEAAVYIRTRCGVTSRSEIKPGSAAATKLDFIESAFICWRDKAKYIEAAE